MNDFTKILRGKGWLSKEVGERWGVGPNRMSQISKAPGMMHLDAVNGLPRKEKGDASLLLKENNNEQPEV
jgi:hypothetical protein